MTAPQSTYTLLGAFVDELARCGMRDACTSPGSRSAPLVLTLASEPRLRCHSHIDERCSSFFALGLAKASGLPVAVACTSGTAAAEMLPAAVEAHEARVPLLLLTADRPAELRENGAGQAIDQIKMLGSAAKWFFEVSVHDAGPQQLRWMRTLACRAYWTALEGRPGAVHLNFPLREPLVGEVTLDGRSAGRQGGRPWVSRPSRANGGSAEQLALLAQTVAGARRGVLVAGRHERRTSLGTAAAEFAAAAGWPLLADPLSGARRGDAAIAHYDALLRDSEFAARQVPDVVLRVGDLPVSKPLRTWLQGLGQARQVALDEEGAWQDPDSVLEDSVALEPAGALRSLRAALGARRDGGEWLQDWLRCDRAAALAMSEQIPGQELSEPGVAALLGSVLPSSALLFVASSMPVRDIETMWQARDDPPRVLCNRGANGIDGIVSSAFGAAAAGEGPVVLLIGDVALAYDIGGLLAARRLGIDLTIVLLENEGGGIFDFLPLSAAPLGRAPDGAGAGQDIYSRHVLTAPGIDFSRAAELYGLRHELPADVDGVCAALERAIDGEGSTLIEVRCSRELNVALHRRLWSACSQALAQPASSGSSA